MIPRMSLLAQNTQVGSTMDAYVHVGRLGAVFDGLGFLESAMDQGLEYADGFPTVYKPRKPFVILP
jgi:hypothetical protein